MMEAGMGRRKQAVGAILFVDGCVVVGEAAVVALPQYILDRLSERERNALLPQLSVLETGELLDPSSAASLDRPELSAVVRRIMGEMKERFKLARGVVSTPLPDKLPERVQELLGSRDEAAENAGVQMLELGMWALSLHPKLLEPVRDRLPEDVRWVVDALSISFQTRSPSAFDTVRAAWAQEAAESRPPSHDVIVAHAYRRALTTAWARSILHHTEDECRYKAQARDAAAEIGAALEDIALRHFPPKEPKRQIRCLNYLDELERDLPVDTFVPMGKKLTEVLVRLRWQGGQMKRFLGHTKPRTRVIKKEIARRFGVSVAAIHKALTRARAKKEILAGL
jgi:hypothetical protein